MGGAGPRDNWAVEAVLDQARAAYERHDWNEAFEVFKQADSVTRLAPKDLEAFAEASWWIGHPDVTLDARERAHLGFLDAGDIQGAARMAVRLSWDNVGKNAVTTGMAWAKKAESLLESEPEGPSHGALAELQSRMASQMGDFDRGVDLGRKASEIGKRFGVAELEAMGTHAQGYAMVLKGQVSEGMALIDSATMAGVSAGFDPFVTGVLYCSTIGSCASVSDYRRAGEWTAAAERWCERSAVEGFPGICRVHKAEITRLKGDWVSAEREARKACGELEKFFLFAVGWAHYEIGEIRLRLGDIGAADEAFRQANIFGKIPQPGLSLARLIEGKTASALASIRRGLSAQEITPPERARLLPAAVEIAVAAGEIDSASGWALELEQIAEKYGTEVLRASAFVAKGQVNLASGSPEEAEKHLRQALRLWREVEIPYETARTLLLIGEAIARQGDVDSAVLEIESARETFLRLKAAPDVTKADSLIAELRPALPGIRTTKTLMFTDIVKSTDLISLIGDRAWEHVIRWHDATMRGLFKGYGGVEVNHAGDGFFVAFDDPASALECAVSIQRSFEEHRRTQGFAPQVRIGLHETAVTEDQSTIKGHGVHLAARVGALADADEIVASESTFLTADLPFSASEPETVSLKGISEPTEVVRVEWRG